MASISTSVELSRLREALATQRLIFKEEQDRAAQIQERAEVARKELAECGALHTQSMQRQSALSHTIMVYQDLVEFASQARLDTVTAQAAEPNKPKAKARIGDKRYRMLNALRDAPADLINLAARSFVSSRGVKAQMADDIEGEFVSLEDETYALTPDGLDLLERFEEYRRGAGKELPRIDAPTSGEDQDEAAPEPAAEEEEKE